MLRTILTLWFLAGLTASAAAFSGCGRDDAGGQTSGGEGSISVSASTPHLFDLARNVAGGRAGVVGILGVNSDPHGYEPLPSDAEALLDADLILRSGGDVDLWLDQLVESSGSTAPELVLLDQVGSIGDDAHWWQDPSKAILAVEAIRDELIAIDPGGRETYEENARVYGGRLRQLDREVSACLGSVEESDRRLVTSHDSFGAYAARYDIEIVGAAIPALTTQAQPSAGETAELVELIRAAGVTTIFPEAGVSGELEAAIADEAGASVGGELWADTLGPEGSDGETYVESIESNTEKLVEGFTAGAESCSFGRG